MLIHRGGEKKYLGPSLSQLSHLFLLTSLNTVVLFALIVLLLRTAWSLGTNTTTIETWEIERHETLVRRARRFGGFLDGPDGTRIRIRKQEFPYDIGIWANIEAGMASRNVNFPLLWTVILGSFFLLLFNPTIL